ncbi:hypothetical protein EVAR_70804_1 [Eumeta japonica]|uniref:Uncharacterized protein n=1 Tax=Eumeta variegata TaxID=151549 RepID=A0A4C1SD51_EUMVA|nr:hypothetical protein EVAR_70804_1 [Eumeta japonica]
MAQYKLLREQDSTPSVRKDQRALNLRTASFAGNLERQCRASYCNVIADASGVDSPTHIEIFHNDIDKHSQRQNILRTSEERREAAARTTAALECRRRRSRASPPHTAVSARRPRLGRPFTYLWSPPGSWVRGHSCLGLRTGVSPHFSTNSMRAMVAVQ